MRIAVYDHDTRNGNPGRLVARVREAVTQLSPVHTMNALLTEIVPGRAVGLLKGEQMVLAHYGNSAEGNAAWAALLSGSPRDVIRVRTSTAGRQDKHFMTPSGVVVLFLRPPHQEVTALQWGLIINSLTSGNCAKSIALTGTVPQELQPFLGSQEPAVVLPALAILCQGYLIVCANQNHGKTVPDYLKRWLSERWTEELTRVNISNVQKRYFWNVFGEQASVELVKLIESEWNRLEGDGELDQVYHLIRAVVPENVTRPDTPVATNPELVACAFMEIERRLWTKNDQ